MTGRNQPCQVHREESLRQNKEQQVMILKWEQACLGWETERLPVCSVKEKRSSTGSHGNRQKADRVGLCGAGRPEIEDI